MRKHTSSSTTETSDISNMYVTRPLSWYLSDPGAAAEAPPEGPGSGFLVVVDEAAEQARTVCCGLCSDPAVRGLPFPQSRQLALRESTTPSPLETCGSLVDVLVEIASQVTDVNSGGAPRGKAAKLPDYVMLVPVVGLPLSSGRYYAVLAEGKHKGKVSACSKEEDKTACCFASCVNDVKPRAFDRGDVYQQVEVQQLSPSGSKGRFKAVAVAADGIPPQYLRNKGWKATAMAKPRYDLAGDAQGVDAALRRRTPPDLDGPGVVVAKWYVPFVFVRADGDRRIKDQFRRCTFYEMTMEQSWEQIYARDDGPAAGTAAAAAEVAVAATVRRATALLDGTYGVREGWPQADGGGAVWFRPAAATTTAEVGLDAVVWERMRWELERGGWVAPPAPAGNGGGEERIERVERRDAGCGQPEPGRHWRKFGCYLLVERFLLRRMDGSLALTCEFRHTDKIRAKWV